MELLSELLQIDDERALHESFQVLIEDLGNLKQIDPKLIKALKKTTYYRDEKKQPVRDNLGRGSKIETFQDKNEGKAFDRLEQKGTSAIIIKYDGTQVIAVVRNSNGGYNSKATFSLVASDDFFKVVKAEDHEKNFSKEKRHARTGRTHTEIEWDFKADKMLSGTSTDVVGKIKKVLKQLWEVAKGTGSTIETMVVFNDEERSAKGEQRAALRKGFIPYPTGNKIAIGPNKYSSYEDLASSFFKSMGSDLRRRLEKYKASKAKSFDNDGEMIKSMIAEGYFEKLKFMGFTYKLYDSRIDFNNLVKAQKGEKYYDGSPLAYVEYKIQDGTPELEKANAEWNEMRRTIGDRQKVASTQEEKDLLSAEYYETKDKIMPPAGFKINLTLKGGVITPSEVYVGKDRSFSY